MSFKRVRILKENKVLSSRFSVQTASEATRFLFRLTLNFASDGQPLCFARGWAN